MNADAATSFSSLGRSYSEQEDANHHNMRVGLWSGILGGVFAFVMLFVWGGRRREEQS